MDKKNFSCSHPVVKSKGKRWYIEFRKVYSNGVRVRTKVYAGINRGQTDEEKLRLAQKYISGFPENYMRSYNLPQTPVQSPKAKAFLDDKHFDWSERSRETYRSRINIFIQWQQQIHGYGPEKTTLDDARAFMVYLVEQHHIGKTTWNAYRAMLKEMFDHWKVRDNPFAPIRIFKKTKTPKKIFTAAEKKKLWQHVKDGPDDMLIYIGLIYYCLIRPPEEIRRLRIGDIDFERLLIRVSEEGKTKRLREAKIPDVFFVYLQRLRGLPSQWFILGRGFKPGPLQAGRKYFLKRMRDLLDEFGFDHRYTAYSWRHNGTIALYEESGRDIFLTSRARGDSSVATTEIYMQQYNALNDPRLAIRNEM